VSASAHDLNLPLTQPVMPSIQTLPPEDTKATIAADTVPQQSSPSHTVPTKQI